MIERKKLPRRRSEPRAGQFGGQRGGARYHHFVGFGICAVKYAMNPITTKMTSMIIMSRLNSRGSFSISSSWLWAPGYS